RPELRPSSRSE
ncbi:hypothetical protein D046_3352B, partial [Vibrio parahaemolyticus V-223/04]